MSRTQEQEDDLIYEPERWTEAALELWSITQEEQLARQQLEQGLAVEQGFWHDKALQNLQADKDFYQELLEQNRVEWYLFDAVKKATLQVINSILFRHTREQAEDRISRLLITPNKKQVKFAAEIEESESLYSFQNLTRGRRDLLEDDCYVGKVTDVSLQVVEDELDKNYGKFIFIFEVEIAEGFYTGQAVKIPLFLAPYTLDLKFAGETEEQRQERLTEFRNGLLQTFRNLGVVVTDSNSAIMSQIPRAVGNTIAFRIDNDGAKVLINKLIERAKMFDEMLSYDDLPDGNDLPI